MSKITWDWRVKKKTILLKIALVKMVINAQTLKLVILSCKISKAAKL